MPCSINDVAVCILRKDSCDVALEISRCKRIRVSTDENRRQARDIVRRSDLSIFRVVVAANGRPVVSECWGVAT